MASNPVPSHNRTASTQRDLSGDNCVPTIRSDAHRVRQFVIRSCASHSALANRPWRFNPVRQIAAHIKRKPVPRGHVEISAPCRSARHSRWPAHRAADLSSAAWHASKQYRAGHDPWRTDRLLRQAGSDRSGDRTMGQQDQLSPSRLKTG